MQISTYRLEILDRIDLSVMEKYSTYFSLANIPLIRSPTFLWDIRTLQNNKV